MFKKITILFILLCTLAIGLIACSSTEAQSVEPGSTQTVSALENITVAEETAVYLPVVTKEASTATATYTLVETGQGFCYNSDGENIDCPAAGEAFYGQDAQFTGTAFDFTDNGDGTVTDNVTTLLWQQTPDSGSLSWEQAQTYCESLTLVGQDDWRMPSLKELFSISNFSTGWPYLDTTYFDLTTTDTISKDEQYWASDYYVGQTAEGGYDAAFGVNHATGHIKAYPALVTGPMGKNVRCVSGEAYLINDFVDNGDGTITDNATALMWTQADSGEGMDWETALAYAESFSYAGYDDWRLPNVKELQSIVDYNYAPDAEDAAYDGPAMNPMFSVSEITNETGELDYPYYWTSTSARFNSTGDFYYAWYVAAGRAVNGEGVDFHGAGAVRFDTKVEGGPAGEGGERYYNYVMLVRGGDVSETPDGDLNANDTAPELEFAGSGGSGGAPVGDSGSTGGGMPDFAAAAAQLGITEEALKEAMGDPSQGQPDFEAVAAVLGITAEELENALMNSSATPTDAAQSAEQPTEADAQPPAADGQPPAAEGQPGGPGGQHGGPGGQSMIDLAAAAEQLGVTEEALIAAMGEPGQSAPDFAAIAATLGVTEADLMAALGIVEGGMPPGGQPPSGQP